MNATQARLLIDSYVDGWVNSDMASILSSLNNSCTIIESHGPTYYGKEQVKKWANEWYQTGKVDKWDIGSFFYTEDTAFFEWSFMCTIDGKTDSIDGASVVQFKNGKISHIHEYRMTKHAFNYF